MYIFLACENPLWSGNGFCDDENNNVECNFDGGDCCLDEVDKHYCSECICHENTYHPQGHSIYIRKVRPNIDDSSMQTTGNDCLLY